VLGICCNQEQSLLHLGGFDPNYSSEDFYKFPILRNDRYSLNIETLQIGSVVINSRSYEGIIDTTYDDIYIPSHLLGKAIEAFKEFYGKDCHTSLCTEKNHIFSDEKIIRPPETMPNVTITINQSAKLHFTLEAFLTYCRHSYNYCSMVRIYEGSKILLGRHFLENFYTVIDLETATIALAPISSCEKSFELKTFAQESDLVELLKVVLQMTSMCFVVVAGWRCGKAYENEFDVINPEY